MNLAPLPLASYKVRLHDHHVRAMPERSLDGAPFSGAGVDLRGEDARAVEDALRPVLDWLEAREPGVIVRSISVRPRGPRILVSLGPPNPHGLDARPRAVRFEPPYADELRELAKAAEHVLGVACAVALKRRGTSP
jgi:hypothetical protein